MNERWDTSSAAHKTWMFPLECGSQASSHQSQELDHIFSLGVHDVAKKKSGFCTSNRYYGGQVFYCSFPFNFQFNNYSLMLPVIIHFSFVWHSLKSHQKFPVAVSL